MSKDSAEPIAPYEETVQETLQRLRNVAPKGRGAKRVDGRIAAMLVGELVLSGMPQAEIGRQIGKAKQQIGRWWTTYRKMLAEDHAERLETIRDEQVARRLKIWSKLYASIEAAMARGDFGAIASLTSSAERVLSGLDQVAGIRSERRADVSIEITAGDPGPELLRKLDALDETVNLCEKCRCVAADGESLCRACGAGDTQEDGG